MGLHSCWDFTTGLSGRIRKQLGYDPWFSLNVISRIVFLKITSITHNPILLCRENSLHGSFDSCKCEWVENTQLGTHWHFLYIFFGLYWNLICWSKNKNILCSVKNTRCHEIPLALFTSCSAFQSLENKWYSERTKSAECCLWLFCLLAVCSCLLGSRGFCPSS